MAHANLYANVVDIRSHILRQIIEGHALNPWSGISGVQDCLPLHETGGWNPGLAISLGIYFFPRTPVAIRIVNIAATGKEFDVPSSAKLGASPAGKNLGIIDVALVGALRLWRGAKHENLAQVAAGSIEASTRSFREGSDLRRADFQQIAEIFLPFHGEDVSAVPGSSYQPPTPVKCQPIHDVLSRSPHAAGRAVRGDAVNFRTAGSPRTRRRKVHHLRHHGLGWSDRYPCRRPGKPGRGRGGWPRGLAKGGYRILTGPFFADAGSVDVSRAIERKRRDFLFGRAVENESFTGRRDAVYESAAIRARDQIPLGIECEYTDVRLITFEKQRVFAFWRYLVNLAAIPGGYIKISGTVEREIPDVLGTGIEVDGRTPVRIELSFGLVGSRLRRFGLTGGLVLDFVDFAVRRRAGVNNAILVHRQGLHLQFGRFKNRGRLPVGSDPIEPRRSARGCVDIARFVGRDGPDVGGRCCVEYLEGWSKLQASDAADGDTRRRALGAFLKFRLFPGAGAFCKDSVRQANKKKNSQLPAMDLQVLTSLNNLWRGKFQGNTVPGTARHGTSLSIPEQANS